MYADTKRAAIEARLVANGLDQVAAAEMAKRLAQTPKVNCKAYAQSWALPGIALNAKWGKDPAGITKHDVTSQFHPVGTSTIRSVVDHEFGNQLDDLLSLAVDVDFVKVYTKTKLRG